MIEFEKSCSRAFTFSRKRLCKQNTTPPIISVICINKNHGSYLEDNILSVLSQDCSDFEFLLADGGSTDNSLEIVAKYDFITLLPGKDRSRNEGVIKAVMAARGRYIMITTSTDGYLSRDWFRRSAAELDADPTISMVFGASAEMSKEGSLGGIAYPRSNHFHQQICPKKWTKIWLLRGISKAYFPELNYCVRGEVMKKLIDKSKEFPELDVVDPILRFHFQFNQFGYLAKYLPILANFGRAHENSAQASESHQTFLKIYDVAWKKLQKALIFNNPDFKKQNKREICTGDFMTKSIYLQLIFFYYFINPLQRLYNNFKYTLKRLLNR